MARKLMLLAALPLFLSLPALAQSADQAPAAGVETPPPPAASDTTAPESGAETMPLDTASSGSTEILTEESDDQVLAAKIVGKDVVDASGESIAKVDDVLLDKSGQVSGLVLSSGGVLGMGGKIVAISWQDVAAAEGAEAITVDLTAEQLAAAPEFRTKEQKEAEALSNAPAPLSDPAAPAAPAPTQ
jgi:sporulation protein YlmC with PRC-barrel domain